MGNEGILLVRGRDKQVRAFSNVCQHRGHELLPCEGFASGKVIQCPYHAWVYDFDGTLRGAPSFRDLDLQGVRLLELPLVDWHGWLFVNAADNLPFESYVAGLEELIGPYRPERLVRGAVLEYEAEANYKVFHENFHECYHCASIHPELCKVTPIDSGLDFRPAGSWAGGNMELMDHAVTMSLSGASDGVFLFPEGDVLLRTVQYIDLFPTLLISTMPDYVMTHRIEPISTTRSRVVSEFLFDPEYVGDPSFDPTYATEFWDITNREDWGACESVQRGAGNRGFHQGPLSPRETTVYQFLTLVAKGYRDGVLSYPEVADRRLITSAQQT
jgi:Rieske 2Fe-2S family protein